MSDEDDSRILKRTLTPKVPHDLVIDEDGEITITAPSTTDIAAKLRKALAARFGKVVTIPPDPHLPALLKSRGARAGVIQTPFHSDDILKGFGKPSTGALRASMSVGSVVDVDPNDPTKVVITHSLAVPHRIRGVAATFVIDDVIPAERFLFSIQLDPECVPLVIDLLDPPDEADES